MRSLIALIILALFFYQTIKSRYAGMLMYWWFAFFRPHEWMWWDLSALRLPLVAAVLFVIPSLFAGYYPRIKGALPILMIIFVIGTIISTVLEGCPFGSAFALDRMITLVLVVLITERLIENERGLLGVIFTAAISLCYFSGRAGLYALIGSQNLYDVALVKGFFAGSNALALGTAMLVPWLIFISQNFHFKNALQFIPPLFRKHDALRKIMLVVVLPLLTCGAIYYIIACESRGSAIALGLGLITWALLHPKRLKLIFGGIVVLAIGLAIIPLPEGYSERIMSAFKEEEDLDSSAASRPHFWRIARKMASDHTFGVGSGCYSRYYDSYDTSNGLYGSSRSVHSSHFQIVGEMGYPGLVIWILLFLVSYYKLWKIRRIAIAKQSEDAKSWFYFYFANAMLTSQTIFLVGGSFYEMSFNDITWLIFGFAIAATRTQKALENQNTEKEGTKEEQLKTT